MPSQLDYFSRFPDSGDIKGDRWLSPKRKHQRDDPLCAIWAIKLRQYGCLEDCRGTRFLVIGKPKPMTKGADRA